MRTLVTFILVIFPAPFIWLATDAYGDQSPCSSAGSGVLASWHQLDACVSYGKVQQNRADDIKAKLSQKYPKIKHEIDVASPLSESEKKIVEATPFDFTNNQNSVLLERICETTEENLSDYSTNPEWTALLTCWQ